MRILKKMDLAAVLGVNVDDIDKLGIPRCVVGNVSVYLESDVIAFLKLNRIPPIEPKVSKSEPQRTRLAQPGRS